MTSNQRAYHLTRIALAFVYLYFGGLKFVMGWSPAESLAGETIHLISLEYLSPELSLRLLAVFETVLGLLLLTNKLPKTAYFLFLIHMAGTFMPFFLLPEVSFNGNPLMPTLVGQYIWKNIVYVVAVSAIFAPVVFARNEESIGSTESSQRTVPQTTGAGSPATLSPALSPLLTQDTPR